MSEKPTRIEFETNYIPIADAIWAWAGGSNPLAIQFYGNLYLSQPGDHWKAIWSLTPEAADQLARDLMKSASGEDATCYNHYATHALRLLIEAMDRYIKAGGAVPGVFKEVTE